MFVCILGLLAFSLWSTSAFAQASLAVSSVPRTTAVSTGHTEIAGDILVQHAGVGALGAGSATLTIDYGVPITVPATSITVCASGSLAAGPGIGAAVGACATPFTANPTGANVGTSGTFTIGGSNQNQLLIVLPGYGAAQGVGTLTITNVKVSLAASTATRLTATLATSASATFGAYSIGSGQNLTDVITAIAPAFTTATATSSAALPALSGTGSGSGLGKGSILTTTTVSDRSFNIDIPENFIDAFKTTTGSSGYLNDPSLTLTFNNIPTGVFLNLAGGSSGTSNALCTAATAGTGTDTVAIYNASSGVSTAVPITNLSNSIISNTTNSTVLSFTGITFNNTALEGLRIRGCIYTSGATAPLPISSITATITLSPNGVALSSGAQITPVAGNFPRYQSSSISVTVVDIVQAETDMLISFAIKNSSGFDTGIAIANTSTDPLGAVNGATPNDGTVKLTFYPQGSGSSFSYTTGAGAPGQGLTSGGVLASGKTWTVGLGELLGAISGAPTSFTGYIVVQTSFTNGHGAAYLTDYKGFTSATPVLVIVPGRSISNENLNQ